MHFRGLVLFLLFSVGLSSSSISLAATDRLAAKYAANDVRILVVPGHDDESAGGAVFRGTREADMNLLLADELLKFLDADPHFNPSFTRDAGGYTPEFSGYFSSDYSRIVAFREEAKKYMNDLLSRGVVQKNAVVHHNYASESDSFKLYGINKWANDHGIDLVLHIHFNDYSSRYSGWAGEYSGFSIYVPEKQLPNHDASLGIAQSIFDRLRKYFPVSDYPPESVGIVEDQELIAVGSNASLEGAAVLIEYGYIYESQFVGSRVRSAAMKELAYQTYLGIRNYFVREAAEDSVSILPYKWTSRLEKGLKNNRDVFALQVALTEDGLYPPVGFTKNDCGITGNFGTCTQRAISSFQKRYGLPQVGFVGPGTLAKLNELYAYDTPKTARDFAHFWERDLHYGLMDDDEVRALQNALYLEGVYHGPMSGNFLELTRDAVVGLQKKHDFSPALQTGYAGPRTRALLNTKYATSSVPL